MSLFIGRDDGSGSFFPGQVSLDLIAISNMDLGYGETNNVAEPRGIQVTYTRNDPGVCPVRLDDLVNTAYTNDFIIWAVDDSFVTAGGVPINTAAGIAMQIGSTSNPTSDWLTIYDTSDCAGEGWCVFDIDGDGISNPSSVILYHELSHLHDYANGVTSTEPDATTDENDMRDQLGLTRRDPNNHSGGCGGCPTVCCIVASISTGSSFSSEVNALRKIRDYYLRSTDVGREFFDHLHHDYYGFSPEVCRLMARNADLTSAIKEIFVRPLICILQTLSSYVESPADCGFLGRQFEHNVKTICDVNSPEFSLLAAKVWRFKRGDIGEAGLKQVLLEAGLDDLSSVLTPGATSSIYIRWAIVEMIIIFLEAYDLYSTNVSHEALGKHLASKFDEWAPQMPLTEVWSTLPTYSLRKELCHLLETILRTKRARNNFADRLTDFCPAGKLEKYRKTMVEAGLLPGSPGGEL